MTYKFKYRRRGLFYKTVSVVGHKYSEDLDRMSLYLDNGGIREVAFWKTCDCKLGPDWVSVLKKDMEKKTGQPVVVNRDLDAN